MPAASVVPKIHPHWSGLWTRFRHEQGSALNAAANVSWLGSSGGSLDGPMVIGFFGYVYMATM
jgi:hypothetical protein